MGRDVLPRARTSVHRAPAPRRRSRQEDPKPHGLALVVEHTAVRDDFAHETSDVRLKGFDDGVRVPANHR